MEKKKRVVVFEDNYKYYFTNAENFYHNYLNKNQLTEMTGFNSLEECKEYLENYFDYEVKIAK